MKKRILIAVLLILFSNPVFSQDGPWRYFGQEQPGNSPALFAPGIVSVRFQPEESPPWEEAGPL